MPKWRLPLGIDDVGYETWVLRNFPGLKGLTYLNSAGFTPIPAVTIARMKKDFEKNFERMYADFDEEAYLAEFRKRAASLIGAKREETAFVTSTTAGISLFANSVKWERGDNIVLADVEYPSNILPWVKIANANGVRIKVVESKDGLVPIDSVEKAVDRKTRVLPISLVEFASGQRFDVKHLSEICEKTGTLLFLDAIQALGAIKVDVKTADTSGCADLLDPVYCTSRRSILRSSIQSALIGDPLKRSSGNIFGAALSQAAVLLSILFAQAEMLRPTNSRQRKSSKWQAFRSL